MKSLKTVHFFLLSILILVASCQNKKAKTDVNSDRQSTNASKVNVPEWSEDAVIYEVNLRQYTNEGTIEAFRSHLPRLKDLGVEILWFMPMHPISEKNRKGSLGSYYAVQEYKAINPNYGTFDEFKSLVTECHEMGFKVILDWVANHTGWDNQWIVDHPEWYAKDSLGQIVMAADWADVAQLNYDNEEMHEAMIDALSFWVREADVDGYRCDVAGMVPVEFWDKARAYLDKIKPVYMLAEDEGKEALLMNAFNANYGWEFHHIMNKIAKGESGPKEVRAYFEKIDTAYPSGAYAMQFTSNHDENTWNGSAPKRLGEALETMAVLSFMVPGMPLIYSGQEARLDKDLVFFDKDEINWEDIPLQAFYKELVEFKKSNKALWNGNAGADIHFLHLEADNQLLAFSRSLDGNKVVVLINLSPNTVFNKLNCPSVEGNYMNLFTKEEVLLKEGFEVTLLPWDYLVLRLNI